ncbi:AraC family transcriptional regulator [Herbaspirillum sp. GCM10030257]|uniref:AraC family transcriptional regulator n=1 Tax=Herbaspirillum sp. GCM10030257 TaxID=3273393 RepID=UPI00361E8B78
MAQPTTAGAWLNSVADMLASIGLDAESLFKHAGIDPGVVRDPHSRFESDRLSQLWILIRDAAGDPAVGLSSADRTRPASLDMLTYAMMTAPNLLNALERFVRYVRIISDATTFWLEDNQDGQWLKVTIEGGQIPVPRQRYEFILITILNICRWIASKRIEPLMATFASPAPVDVRPYREAFCPAMRFDDTVHGVLFSRADLMESLPASNARLSELHERFIGDFIEKMDQHTLTNKVRGLIVRGMPDGDPQRADIAASLCISERTLQRRLKDEGTSFQELLDDTRRDLARKYLGEMGVNFAQVAFLLGFADQSAFNRACQRWFNLSPSQLRKKLNGQASLP